MENTSTDRKHKGPEVGMSSVCLKMREKASSQCGGGRGNWGRVEGMRPETRGESRYGQPLQS